jgi:thymidylate synthase
VPCNICASLKVRGGRLHWLQVMRSNDLVRGLPYNFVQFTTLQEVMAGWLGVGVGEYTHIADSLHVYNSDLEVVMHSKRENGAENADSLAVPKDEFDSILPTMIESIAACADPHIHATELHRLNRTVSVPESYRNLLLVVAAESARRRHWPNDAQSLIGCCTNPTLVLLWRKWNDRFEKLIAEK